jgi:translation initiation factor IF-1
MHPSPDIAREEVFMSKEEVLEFEGIVTEVLPDSRFRVRLENDHEIIAYTAGKMKKFRIRTIAGDRVTVEMTPYDLDKGRITFRHKDTKSGSPPPPGQNQNRRPGGNRR